MLFQGANFHCLKLWASSGASQTLNKSENRQGGPVLWLVWQLYFESRCSSVDVSLLI